jgi:hypothetical protein
MTQGKQAMKLDTVYTSPKTIGKEGQVRQREQCWNSEFVDNSGVEILEFDSPNPVRWSNFVIFLLGYNSKRAETY